MNAMKMKRIAAGAALAGWLAVASMALGSGLASADDTFWVPQPSGPEYADVASVPSLNVGHMPRVTVPGHWAEQ
jgi:hypothetical protein